MRLNLDVWTPDGGWGTVNTAEYVPSDSMSLARAVDELANRRVMWMAMNYFGPDAVWHIDLPGLRRPEPRQADAITRNSNALTRKANSANMTPVAMRNNAEKMHGEANPIHGDGTADQGCIQEETGLPEASNLPAVRKLLQA